MIRYAGAAILLLAAAPVSSQQGAYPPRWGLMEPHMRTANISRLHQVVVEGVPRPYASLRDPLPDTPAKLRRGAALFQRNCASCHGVAGEGNGEGGAMLVPSPADLEWLARTPAARSGPYVYWSIAEGGRAFGSDMPAFRGSLSRQEIWAVVAYVRAGLPARR